MIAARIASTSSGTTRRNPTSWPAAASAVGQDLARVVRPLPGRRPVRAGDDGDLHERDPLAGPAAGLGQQPDVGELRAAIDRLDHVVERQPGDDDRRQRLHLDAGAIGRPRRRGDRDAVVAERRGRRSPPCSATGWHSGTRSGVRLARGDAGDARDGQRVALGQPVAAQQRDHLRRGDEPAGARSRCAAVTSLPETSTMRAAPLFVEMGEFHTVRVVSAGPSAAVTCEPAVRMR